MTLPTVTVTGTYKTPAGMPQQGGVLFRLLAPLLDVNDNVMVPAGAIPAPLDGEGAFAQKLVPSDAAGLSPIPVAYRVTEQFPGGRTYDVLVPSVNPTSDLSDLAPIGTPPAPPSAYALALDLATETAARVAGDAAETIARTAQINALLNGAPAALNTLKELADALNDDANFASTVTTQLATTLTSATGRAVAFSLVLGG